MKSHSIIYTVAAIIVMSIAACYHSPQGWSIDGEIAGDEEYTLSLEGFNNGLWYVVDSLKTKDGGFSYVSESPAAYPEIMRLGLDGQYIYFPIDSIDNVSIYANANNFSTGYRLDGTTQARTIKSLDSIINTSIAERGASVTLSDPTLKQELFVRAFDDPSVMPLYYLINKSVGDRSLYDPYNPEDTRLFGALAQRFVTEAPNDPRGQLFAAIYKKARTSRNGRVHQLEVPELSIIDIVRYDRHGQRQSLADMASNGDVVLLSFTAYGLENSTAYNIILNSLYDKYHSKGLQIFQIAFDEDEAFWKENARNIPWTAVWNSTTDGDEALINYNVGKIPTTYIIDRSGTLAARVDDPNTLADLIPSYL